MRLALIANDHIQQFPLLNYGGIESCVENLANGLFANKRDFFVICPKRDFKKEYPFEIYETEELPTIKTKKNSFSFAYSAAKILKNLNFDIIWSQSHWGIEPFLSFKKPIISTFHDSCEKQYGWIKKYKNVKYRFISKFQYDLWVKEEWEKECCFWAYTGLTNDNFVLDKNKENYFLWCAGLNWGLEAKGLDYFINIAKENKNFEFIAYGSGNKSVENYLYSLNKDIKNFNFYGSLKRGEQHTNVFKKAKGFFMPTRLPEAFGRTVIESLSKGTPVYGSNNGAINELIQNKINGFKFNLDDLNIDLNYNFDYNSIYENSKKYLIDNEIEFLEKESLNIL